MRHLFLMIFALIMLSPAAVDGQGLFIRLGGGYALGASGDDSGVQAVNTGSTYSESVVFSSLGQGGLFGLDIGYWLNENIGVQFGAEYLAGAEHLASSVEATGTFESTVSSRGNQFRLVPAVVIQGGLGALDPYARFGVSLPISSTTTNSVLINETDFVTGEESERYYEEEIKGASNLGFNGALGVNYAVGSQLALFAEVGGISQRTHGVSGMVTRQEVDGVDAIDPNDTFNNEWNYLDELGPESNSTLTGTNVDSSLPEDRIQISQNFNSFYLKVGVSLLLGGASYD